MQPSYAHKRRAQLGELLREKIALILLHKTRDPRLSQLAVTEVELSDDLRQAKVFYISRALNPQHTPEQAQGELAQTQAALDRASGFIKQEIAHLHILRFMPQITFAVDQSWQRGIQIERLLAELKTPSPGEPQNSS